MSYTPNVPTIQPRQSLNQARPLFNTNFSLIQTAFDQDHIDFNAAGAGKHTAVHFPAAANATQAETVAGEIALYSKSIGGIPRLVMREPSNGAERQISGPVFTGKGVLLNGGATPLFGGLQLLFGQTAIGAGTTTISFVTECGMNLTTLFNVVPTNPSAVGAISLSAEGPTGFKATANGATTLNFMAIGIA